MKIPYDAFIPPGKLDRYLLIYSPTNDKSRWLAQAGFGLTNVAVLEEAIRHATATTGATVAKVNAHGTYYSMRCKLVGPLGILPVVLIWLHRLDGIVSVVTLVPYKEK